MNLILFPISKRHIMGARLRQLMPFLKGKHFKPYDFYKAPYLSLTSPKLTASQASKLKQEGFRVRNLY